MFVLKMMFVYCRISLCNAVSRVGRKGEGWYIIKFVSNNFRRKASVSEMLHNLGWQSLDSRRQDQRLVLFYKIINGLASVETEDILTPADSRTRKNHSFKFKHLQANCDSYRYSFSPATISSWNNLLFGIEKVDSVEGFKLKLKEHTFRSP